MTRQTQFQFYKVRLKQNRYICPEFFNSFQFYKVRLKHNCRTGASRPGFQFQFYKVRLKHGRLLNSSISLLFQFYKVRLKQFLNYQYYSWSIISILQSSIKTSMRKDLQVGVEFQFYKVRLKRRRSGKKKKSLYNFNSTKFD